MMCEFEMHLRTLWLLLWPFKTLQLLLHNYQHPWGHLVLRHASNIPFQSAMQRTDGTSATWQGHNSLAMQTSHLQKLNPQAFRMP
jgi:hypothetical protein